MWNYDLEKATAEKQKWSEDQDNSDIFHSLRSLTLNSVLLQDRAYLFTNLSATAKSPLKILDFERGTLHSISELDNRPSTTRIGYSLAPWKNKVYIYGGIDEQNKVLECMDEFDAVTLKFTAIKYRGEGKLAPKGRHGHTAVVLDQYNMLVIGGSQSSFLIDADPIKGEQAVVNFDMDANTWSTVRRNQSGSTEGAAEEPSNLYRCSGFKLDSANVCVLWYKIQEAEVGEVNRQLRVSILNVTKGLWRDIEILSNSNYRLGSQIVPFFTRNVLSRVLILGGVGLSKDDEAESTKLEVTTLEF